MYRPFKRLRVRFVECDMKQSEVAKAAGMAPSTLCARMQGKQPFTTWEISRVVNGWTFPATKSGHFSLMKSQESGVHDGKKFQVLRVLS